MVARWMTQRFPHPYTHADAREWIAAIIIDPQDRHFAIEVDGTLAGGIGIEPCDGERRGAALFGYWLGRAYWGRGIGTDAARTLSDYVLRMGFARRLEASVFAPNVASAKVLVKCGFALEGTLRGLYVDREGAICDALLFARLADPSG
jgi:ribosomal-protein-alanine N-acetyltransferase